MKRILNTLGSSTRKLFVALCVVASTVIGSYAQSPAEAEAVGVRLARARALAAAHNLAAAANELEAIRKTTTDDSVRTIARLMLMGICLEEGNYMRAQSLLDEVFTMRSAQNAGATEAYFALAGHSLNGARAHLERYRAFGISVTSKDLPAESVSDLDRLRVLLEKIADQARQMTAEDLHPTPAAALLEDVSSLRASLSRTPQERQQWQREMASARAKLSAEEPRMTPVSNTGNSQRRVTANINGSAHSESTPNPASSIVSPATNIISDNREKSPAPPVTTAANPSAATVSSKEAQVSDGKPLNLGSLIDKATQKINPSYPLAARGARITGVVTVYLEVDQNGVVSTAQGTTGPMLLRQAAVDAARRWKFRPTLVEGQPVRVVGFINFNFTL